MSEDPRQSKTKGPHCEHQVGGPSVAAIAQYDRDQEAALEEREPELREIKGATPELEGDRR